MSRNTWWAKTLRIIGIVLMSLTAAFTLMGGAGTSCVALNPTGFGDSFAPIAKVQWLYILFVLVTLAIGVMGVRAVVLLVQGKRVSPPSRGLKSPPLWAFLFDSVENLHYHGSK
jgi:hypothetical protein